MEGVAPVALPLHYFVFSTLCLALTLAAGGRYAQDFTGFYYHPRILAMTHLVTLGWISSNILGALYIVGPMSLQMRHRIGKADYVVFWLYAIGVSGMVSHFWIAHQAGMAWSGACVYAALLWYFARFFRSFKDAKAPTVVKAHIYISSGNFLLAGLWGLLVAINKTKGFLPTPVAANLYAHAHLAAIGWASLMVFGTSYRLVPMFLPGEPVKGPAPWISLALIEAGTLGLVATFLAQSAGAMFFGILIAAGILLFLALTVRTALRPKPAPPPVPPKPDFAMLQVLMSFLFLAAAIAAGLALTRLAADESSLRLALAYGFAGLVGFLSQMVVAMRAKILSVFTWYHAFAQSGSREGLARPVDMPVRTFQAFVFALWLVGVPLFIAGLIGASRWMILSSACLLEAALVLSTIHEISILSRLRSAQNAT